MDQDLNQDEWIRWLKEHWVEVYDRSKSRRHLSLDELLQVKIKDKTCPYGLVAEFRVRLEDELQELRDRCPLSVGNSGSGKSDSAETARIGPPDFLPELPRYKILGEIGRGGMGVVYEAQDLELKRTVALKMILAGGHERFWIEGESVARLQHDNIVQVFDVGKHEGKPYLALEFCDGGTLAEKLASTPQPAREAAKLIETLARAIAHAHGNDIVHRDLKPTNVLLTADGKPKVTDFGLAKLLDAADHLTQDGAVMGTPSYMAPEQAAGDTPRIGPACDVYALGSILYECLTGRPPFKGANPVETRDQVRHQPPVSPRELNPKVPRDLETICLKCLRKEPERRYASAVNLAEDLRRWQDGKPIEARPISRTERTVKWVKRNPAETVFMAVIVVLLLGGSGLVYAKYLEAKGHEHNANLRSDDADREKAEAVKQAGIAKTNEDEAIRQGGIASDRAKTLAEEVRRTKRQRDNATILIAQGDFTNMNALLARDRLEEIEPENRGLEWHYLKRHFEGGLFAIYGHSGRVSSVAISADGGRLVSGSWDRTARICDGRTGQSLLELKGHADHVTSVTVNADGSRIVTGSEDKTARVWDGNSGRRLFVLTEHTDEVSSVAISADGSRIVTGSKDKTARVWDGNSGRRLFVLTEHTDEVSSVAISADGDRIVTGSKDKTARVWDGRTGRSLLELKGHIDGVECVAVSADGGRIVTAAFQTARVWDGRTGRWMLELRGHTREVTSVSISADGGRIITGSGDLTSRVWDGRTGRSLLELKGHIDGVKSVAVSADGGRIVTAADQTLRVWDGRTEPLPELLGIILLDNETRRMWSGRNGRSPLELWGHTSRVESVAVSADGSRIITGSDDNTARIWDGRTGRSLLELKGHTVAVNADGSRIVTGSKDNTARVWDGRTGQCLYELKGHTGRVKRVAMSADGSRIVIGSDDNTARVWDGRTGRSLLELKGHTVAVNADGSRIITGFLRSALVWDGHTGKLLFELQEHNGDLISVAVSADGSRIVTGSNDMTARVWDGHTGQRLLVLKGHTSLVECVAVNADGSRIVTGSLDETVRVWDGQTGQSLLEFKEHTHLITALAMSADRSRIATGSGDQTVRVWDCCVSPSLFVLDGHTARVTNVAVSADGSRVITGSLDKTARVWDSRTGQSLLELKGHTGDVWSVAVNADGSRVITGSDDMTARIWDGRTGQFLLELKGHKNWVRCVGVSADGSRILTYDRFEMIVWDAATGVRLQDEPSPVLFQSTSNTPDGKSAFVPVGNRVQRVLLVVDEVERLRRRWLTRPDPEWHFKRQEALAAEKNDYGVALHRSCEQHARGVLAFEAGDFDSAFAHFIAAAALKPKPPTPSDNSIRKK